MKGDCSIETLLVRTFVYGQRQVCMFLFFRESLLRAKHQFALKVQAIALVKEAPWDSRVNSLVHILVSLNYDDCGWCYHNNELLVQPDFQRRTLISSR